VILFFSDFAACSLVRPEDWDILNHLLTVFRCQCLFFELIWET